MKRLQAMVNTRCDGQMLLHTMYVHTVQYVCTYVGYAWIYYIKHIGTKSAVMLMEGVQNIWPTLPFLKVADLTAWKKKWQEKRNRNHAWTRGFSVSAKYVGQLWSHSQSFVFRHHIMPCTYSTYVRACVRMTRCGLQCCHHLGPKPLGWTVEWLHACLPRN